MKSPVNFESLFNIDWLSANWAVGDFLGAMYLAKSVFFKPANSKSDLSLSDVLNIKTTNRCQIVSRHQITCLLYQIPVFLNSKVKRW